MHLRGALPESTPSPPCRSACRRASDGAWPAHIRHTKKQYQKYMPLHQHRDDRVLFSVVCHCTQLQKILQLRSYLVWHSDDAVDWHVLGLVNVDIQGAVQPRRHAGPLSAAYDILYLARKLSHSPKDSRQANKISVVWLIAVQSRSKEEEYVGVTMRYGHDLSIRDFSSAIGGFSCSARAQRPTQVQQIHTGFPLLR